MDRRISEISDGLYHIYESLGTFCTLIVGGERALLVDTGYGFGELPALVREVTPLPLQVINTHGHMDHISGNRYFDRTMMHRDDRGIMNFHSSLPVKTQIYRLLKNNLTAEEKRRGQGFLKKCPSPASWVEDGMILSLGDRDVEIILTPGHTKGSICLLDHGTGTLLSGDSFSSHVWLFLRESVPLSRYRESIEKVIRRKGEIGGILSSHSLALFRPTLLEKIRRTADNLTLEKCRPFESGLAGRALMYTEGFEEVTRRYGCETFEEMMGRIKEIPPEAIADMEFTSLVIRKSKL